MMTLDSDFKNMASAFLDGVLARTPPTATPEERLFMDYLRRCDDAGLFEQAAESD
jgi:hypothetical protein